MANAGSKVYYSNGWVDIFHGDCRDMLRAMPAESCDICITSPPYLGLRSYRLAPSVWDGDPECQHVWGNPLSQRKRGSLHGANAQAGNTLSGVSGVEIQQGQFCSKCHGWLGCLGLEPDPAMYIRHLVGIFREVRRVLKPWGVMFLNCGDSYFGGGARHGAENDIEGKVPQGSTRHGASSRNLCDECADALASHNLGSDDRHGQGSGSSTSGSSRSHKVRRSARLESSRSTSQGDHSADASSDQPPLLGRVDEQAPVSQETKQPFVSHGLPVNDAIQSHGPETPSTAPTSGLYAQRSVHTEQHVSGDERFHKESSAVPSSLSRRRNPGSTLCIRCGAYVHPQYTTYKPGDLMGIPGDLVRALRTDGWYWRSEIVWHKTAPMPESIDGWRWEKHRVKVKSQDYSEYHQPGKMSSGELSGEHRNRDAVGGIWIGGAQWAACPGCPECTPNDGLVLHKGSWRPTRTFEMVYMLSKGPSYYSDREAVKEPTSPESEFGRNWRGVNGTPYSEGSGTSPRLGHGSRGDPSGRNLRNVWTLGPEPSTEAHFATYPTALVKPCILSSTSERGNCAKCGKPWVRVIKSQPSTLNVRVRDAKAGKATARNDAGPTQTLGFRASCSCNIAETQPAVILDPFAGISTTGVVAQMLGRRAVMIDASEPYCALSVKRLSKLSLPMEVKV